MPDNRLTETAPAGRRRATGKWRPERNVPTSGWRYIGYPRDHAPNRYICEMCETMQVRYSYEMMHPNHPHSLRVGGDCAEMMEGDIQGIRRRVDFQNRQARQSKWMSRWLPVQPGLPQSIKTRPAQDQPAAFVL